MAIEIRHPEINRDGGYNIPAIFTELLSCDNHQPGTTWHRPAACPNADEEIAKVSKATLSKQVF